MKPIAQTVLKVDAFITPTWRFSPRWHSKQEIFWILIDNDKETLHCESFLLSQKDIEKSNEVAIQFFLPFRDSKITHYNVLITSDRWVLEPDYRE